MKTLGELAKLVGGEIKGKPSDQVKSVAALDTAKAGDLTFVLDRKNLDKALRSSASFFVAADTLSAQLEGKSLILVKDVRSAMAEILEAFSPYRPLKREVHKTAVIGNNCEIAKTVAVGPYAIIGDNVTIGEGSTIHGQATIYDGVVIGKNTVIHAGCVLGVDGFGFFQGPDLPAGRQGKKHKKIPQIGTVIIGDNVEIYANVTIARATLGATVIGSGTKIDCGVHIAHNCVIGEDCAITAHAAFAGSVTLGKSVYIAGQSGFKDHITIGENTVILGRSGVTKDIPPNSIVSGFPAQDHKKELSFQSFLRSLPKKLAGK